MGHTNSTTNYDLTQFVGSDKPAWLEDYNGDMLAIDAAMKAISDVADAAKTEADQNTLDIASVTTTANAASAAASGAISNFADAYDATSTYAVKDLVIYNNILYKCITAITTPEAFDGDHWSRTTLENENDNIRSEIYGDILISDASGFTVESYSSVAKTGNMVSGNLTIVGTTSVQTWAVVGNISSHPDKVVNAPLVNDGTGEADGFIRITTTGEIRMFPLTAGLANRSAVIAYKTT